ncbi:unnamed protein product [Rhizoctonia solani]|uniref:Uncharacterized protein n=1 Tax=Rhizoctonia solani TaxID=456999 RepID=A0A8H3GXF9_9AGAM|nr:unnamed protein product [Rhizoctonia solani]
MKYAQATVGLGFIGISSDATKLLRCVLVHTTLPEYGASRDRRTARRCYRYFCCIFEFAFLASTVPGTVASYGYSSARSDQAKADRNLRLLNVSASVVLAFQVVTIIVSMLAAYKVKEINRIRCFELAALTLLVMPVPIYRLCVLQIRTINVFEPLSPSARAIFYIVHLVPEWLCASVLLGTNVRARFCTGRWGDYELRESLRDKRLEKVAENGISLGEVDGSKAV